jgi:excisionase family DNA binding protein
MEPTSTNDSTRSQIAKRLREEENLSEQGIGNLETLIERIVEDMTEAPSPLWTIGDVATRLNVSKRTVENIIDDGKLTPIRVRGQRRFEPEAIEAYLRRNVAGKT